MRYLNSILKFCIIFFAIATVFTACIKDEAPDILDSIAGNYECHLSRIILNDSIEIDPNCMHLGYLSCRAFNIKIIGSGNNYTLNFDSIKINPRTKPDTMLIFNFPSVNVDIVEQGKFEIVDKIENREISRLLTTSNNPNSSKYYTKEKVGIDI